MELNKLSRAEIEERLKDRSNNQLRSLAAEQGVRLPAGLNNRAAILDTIHSALNGAKTSAPAAGDAPSPVAPQGAPDAPAAGQRSPEEPTIMVISVTKQKQFWRFGYKFTPDWQDIPISTFDEPTWRKIRKDKFLRSRGYPKGFAEG